MKKEIPTEQKFKLQLDPIKKLDSTRSELRLLLEQCRHELGSRQTMSDYITSILNAEIEHIRSDICRSTRQNHHLALALYLMARPDLLKHTTS